jgi:hypothetical protein
VSEEALTESEVRGMRRLSRALVTVASVSLLIGAALVSPAAATSEPPALTGFVVHQTDPGVWDYTAGAWSIPPSYEGVGGVAVNAYEQKSSGGPGRVVGSALTAGDGSFAVEALASTVCLGIEPSDGLWQRGWYWSVGYPDPLVADLLRFWSDPPDVCDVPATADLGRVQLMSAVATGRVVSAASGLPLRGAVVRYDPYALPAVTVSAVTDSDGYYRIAGLDYEEYHIRVSARRYQTGYVGFECQVFKSMGEANTWAPGELPCHEVRMTPR